MKTWWVLCACGFAARRASWSGATTMVERHRAEGCEGTDHVTSIEHRDARLVDEKEKRS